MYDADADQERHDARLSRTLAILRQESIIEGENARISRVQLLLTEIFNEQQFRVDAAFPLRQLSINDKCIGIDYRSDQVELKFNSAQKNKKMPLTAERIFQG
jgi:hypothetical protein